MRLSSQSIIDGEVIKPDYALCVPDPAQHARMAGNRSPHIAWSDLPVGTKSLVLLCHDPDVPSKPDDVNQENREVPADLPRVDFFHWVVVDIDPALGEIPEGAFADGVTAHGKDGPDGPLGTRVGKNNYTDWFAGDPDMEGDYFGYDGPCPPWNDSIRHRYVFTLFALDVAWAPVEGSFDGPTVRQAIARHILDEASFVASYSMNPRVPA